MFLKFRVILHEAMEQQTISIAKAGIICQLNTRTAILAAANPKNSKYDTKLSVVENIQLPPTLLSRFDLIYLMLDRNNDAYDRRLANHIISLYGKFEDLEEVQNKYLPKELIAAYISTAKNLKPKMTEEVTKVLVESYIKMRDQGGSRKTVSATPRQLESIIRLSEARAKLRFSQFVEIDDVEEALRLVKVAIQQAATDPETGLIDMDLLNTGQTSTSRSKLASLMDTIKNILVRKF
jgi:DNA replication licensing factor MCM4